MIATSIYSLCAITSIFCAVLLARGYLRSRAKLLLWSTFCFVGLTIHNLLLVVDRVILIDEIDLYTVRLVSAAAALALLVYGLITRVDR
ncbi:MAG TPA: DUF5985 family protein [Actinomycetota bacterium]|nr:DUF5985 family protein [Actinomycetota bacterium]